MNGMSKPTLKLDWCGHDAAKYAVEHWHYSRTMPASKCVKVGVWEDGQFIGAVVFAWGSNPHMAGTVGLKMTECAELVRMALSAHKTPVSRILSIAVRLLKTQSSGLRCMVSYADPYHGHHGGIYQAGGWVYVGKTSPEVRYISNGKMLMRRAFTGSNYGRGKMTLPSDAVKISVPGKHKYLMPLDDVMRARIEPLRKPYPRRVGSAEGGTAGIQPVGGGSNPTPTLLSSNKANA